MCERGRSRLDQNLPRQQRQRNSTWEEVLAILSVPRGANQAIADVEKKDMGCDDWVPIPTLLFLFAAGCGKFTPLLGETTEVGNKTDRMSQLVVNEREHAEELESMIISTKDGGVNL